MRQANRRRSHRVKPLGYTTLKVTKEGLTGWGAVLDISLTGAAIAWTGECPFQPGMRVEVKLGPYPSVGARILAVDEETLRFEFCDASAQVLTAMRSACMTRVADDEEKPIDEAKPASTEATTAAPPDAA